MKLNRRLNLSTLRSCRPRRTILKCLQRLQLLSKLNSILGWINLSSKFNFNKIFSTSLAKIMNICCIWKMPCSDNIYNCPYLRPWVILIAQPFATSYFAFPRVSFCKSIRRSRPREVEGALESSCSSFLPKLSDFWPLQVSVYLYLRSFDFLIAHFTSLELLVRGSFLQELISLPFRSFPDTVHTVICFLVAIFLAFSVLF